MILGRLTQEECLSLGAAWATQYNQYAQIPLSLRASAWPGLSNFAAQPKPAHCLLPWKRAVTVTPNLGIPGA